jgi:hypothetical protein
MPHIDEGTLNALLDGELGAAEVLEVQTHFATCAACAARLDEARQMLAETERLVAALEPPAGNAARAPRVVASRPVIPLDPVVLIPHNPTPTEVRRSRFKIMAWAASFLVIVGAGFLGLEMRNGLQGSRKAGTLRIRPEEFTFAHDNHGDSSTRSAAPVSRPDTGGAPDTENVGRLGSIAPTARKDGQATGPAPAAGTPPASQAPASPAPGKPAQNQTLAQNQTSAAQPPGSPAPGKPGAPPPAAKVVAPLALGGAAAAGAPAAKTAPSPAATQKATSRTQPADELKESVDQAVPSRNAPADSGAISVDRAMADKATADLDREQMRRRAAAATAALDVERKLQLADAEEAQRQEAARAAAAQPATPTIDQQARLSRRIGLDEAAQQLGGPLHAIDGMSRQLVGLVSPQLVSGADSTRPVVRAVYVDRSGRTLYLDQQRVRPGQLDLPFTPQAGPNGQLSWMSGSVLLVLQGDLPPDSLRALARRVR